MQACLRNVACPHVLWSLRALGRLAAGVCDSRCWVLRSLPPAVLITHTLQLGTPLHAQEAGQWADTASEF